MLVLTRKIGETVCVGSEIEVVVLEAGRGRVKLGFAGPRDVSIRRGELSDTLQLPKLDLAQSTCLQEAAINHPQAVAAPLRRYRALAGG
jgi:carbon storage regulator